MGQGGSRTDAKIHKVERCAFSDAEYDALRRALHVTEDEPHARVELAAFMNCFPDHLCSLVQPVFFQLGQERLGEGTAAWGNLVAGLSRQMKEGGLSWRELLQAWSESSSPSDGGPEGQWLEQELELYLELAASLCFWSAYPERSPASSGEESSQKDASPKELVAVLHAGALASLGGTPCTATSVASWLEDSAPMLPRAVGPAFSRALLNSPVMTIPAVESKILNASTILLLRAADARLWESSDWVPLYRDWCDGRSFNALVKGALHYEGPALLLLHTDQGQVLGALSTCWSELNGKYGGTSESFLFALSPTFTLCRGNSRSGNYVYFNSRNKHVPRGLGFGGQVDFCRLWLDVDFEDCYTLESDATYGTGMLLPSSGGLQTRFQVASIEVWGCGGEEARQAQATLKERAENAREQARKVDRAKLCESEFDKEMFFGNTFSATAGSREPQESKDEALGKEG
eukprot:TRINITY_DN97225_c0_g1_i1.p1 TRINITY_DN97225_c0_g1~~TRINITY_DN97225_c0_g1_i1.p1  ORF type:complete len:461 (+),score=81.84 TRINITY_DN97225_c0_g1_i1:62-1444(+)